MGLYNPLRNTNGLCPFTNIELNTGHVLEMRRDRHLPSCTDADFNEYRRQRAWTQWKYTMQEVGCRLPTQIPDGRSHSFCGAEIGLAAMSMFTLATSPREGRSGKRREGAFSGTRIGDGRSMKVRRAPSLRRSREGRAPRRRDRQHGRARARWAHPRRTKLAGKRLAPT